MSFTLDPLTPTFLTLLTAYEVPPHSTKLRGASQINLLSSRRSFPNKTSYCKQAEGTTGIHRVTFFSIPIVMSSFVIPVTLIWVPVIPCILSNALEPTTGLVALQHNFSFPPSSLHLPPVEHAVNKI